MKSAAIHHPSLGLVVLALCPLVISAQEHDSEAARHFLAARRAQAAGDLNLAAQEYLTVIRLEPGVAEVRFNLGLVYHLEARYEESVRELEKALAMKSGMRGADLFLGIDYVKLGRSRQAVSCLERAVGQEPNNKQARTWLGSALWDAGRENDAIRELRDAEQTFPADPDILFLLGQAYRNAANEEMARVLADVGTPLYHQAYGEIYLEEQSWKQALGHFQRALEKDPHWPGAHAGLGEVYLRQGDLARARAEFLAEHSVGKTNAPASARLAEIAILEGRPGDAMRLLEQAIQKDPDAAAHALGLPPLPFTDHALSADGPKTGYRQAAAFFEGAPSSPARNLALAAIDLWLGLARESEREWTQYRAMERSPEPSGDEYERALREFERHDFDAARTRLVSFVAAHPHDLAARYLLASAGRWLSLSVLARMLSSAADSPRTHQLMGETLAGKEENEKALAEYRAAEGVAPTLRGLHFAIGEVLWKANETDAAMTEFQEEIRLNPGYAEASAAVGTILVRQHQAEQAIPHLERAIRLKPELLAAHQELGKAFYQLREFVKAEGEFRKALADDPEGNVHYLLGNVYKELGRQEPARASFAESRRIKTERLNAVNGEKAVQ